MNKAKHAFGMLENIDEALSLGKIDRYDILFVKDENGKPYVGWIDKDGNKVICDSDEVDLSGIEAEIAVLESAIAKKANASDIEALEAEVDAKIEAALAEHVSKKYEIADAPNGTLIKMNENEIRVCCPSDAEYHLQSVGVGGDANTYYITFKTYVNNESVVGYIEHLNGSVDAEILTDLKTDEHGRRYQPTWLGIAKYDEATDTWAYYGKNSTSEKYIGWDYQIDWYDASGVMIDSDSIRINLSNEDCHYHIEPYYMGNMKKEFEVMIDKKIAEIDSVYEVIEF